MHPADLRHADPAGNPAPGNSTQVGNLAYVGSLAALQRWADVLLDCADRLQQRTATLSASVGHLNWSSPAAALFSARVNALCSDSAAACAGLAAVAVEFRAHGLRVGARDAALGRLVENQAALARVVESRATLARSGWATVCYAAGSLRGLL